MLMLLLHIFLLLLLAYLLGAMIACLIKSAFAGRDTAAVETAPAVARAEARPVPAPAPAPAAAVPAAAAPAPAAKTQTPPAQDASTDRFGRALTGDRPAAPAEVSVVRPAAAAEVPKAPAPAPVTPTPAPATATAAPASTLATQTAAAVAAAAAAAAAQQARPAPPPPPPPPPPAPAAEKAAPAPAPAPTPPPAATVAPAAPSTPVAAPAPVPAAPAVKDDLTRIRAIDSDLQARLNGLGVYRFAEIANWTSCDVNRMAQSLGFVGRIEKENWIEQAQILAKGGDTAYSRRPAAAATASAPAAAPQPDAAATAAAAAAAVAAATAAARKVSAEPAAATEAPRPVKLADAIRDTAAKTPEPAPIAPAAQPAPAAPAAPVAPSPAAGDRDLSHLRSVRSEGLRSEPAPSPLAVGSVNDLKRIRGIGVLIEKKLNSLGITTYEQIANWTGADIERLGQHVEPRGRIERENWIEQARILASGGQTDYARRFDRGEVGPAG